MSMCKIFGHDMRFRADGTMLSWTCARGCGAQGHKRYSSAAQAVTYARRFNRRDSDDLGKRAPLFGLLPLRVGRRLVKHADESASGPP